MKVSKLLVLVRHAHRDTTLKVLDNGLSEKGHSQARDLLLAFEKDFQVFLKTHSTQSLHEQIDLLSSPKKRCTETIEPIASLTQIPLRISPWLDEQGPDEYHGDYLARMTQFENYWRTQAPRLTIACSHGDWLPAFCEKVVGRSIHFEKGAWRGIFLAEDALTNPVQLSAYPLQKFFP